MCDYLTPGARQGTDEAEVTGALCISLRALHALLCSREPISDLMHPPQKSMPWLTREACSTVCRGLSRSIVIARKTNSQHSLYLPKQK